MRIFFSLCTAILLISCNQGPGKKEPALQRGDSAGLNQPVADTGLTPKIRAEELPAGSIPPGLAIKGKIGLARKWKDKLGENIFITTYTDPQEYTDKYGDEVRSIELHAYHFVKGEEGNYSLRWKMSDGVKDCSFDLTCGFIPESLAVTDLDQDGIAETTVMYRMACRSDVSPAYLKLLMKEDSTVYSLKGLGWVKLSEEDTPAVTESDANLETLPGYRKTEEEYMKTFGRYESEKGFSGAPASFLPFARRQWLNFIKETFE